MAALRTQPAAVLAVPVRVVGTSFVSGTVNGTMDSNKSYSLSAGLSASWRKSTHFGVFTAYAKASGSLNLTLTGTASNFSFVTDLILHASAGCGCCGIHISLDASASYIPVATSTSRSKPTSPGGTQPCSASTPDRAGAPGDALKVRRLPYRQPSDR